MVAIHAATLPRVAARAPIVKVGLEVFDATAVRLSLFVVQLRVGYHVGGLVAFASPLLLLLVDPGPLVGGQVELAADCASYGCRIPRLVPLASVGSEVLHWLLFVVLVAEVLPHGLAQVLFLAQEHGTADRFRHHRSLVKEDRSSC